MDENQKTFIGWVAGRQLELTAFAEREVDRRLAFDGAMGALAGAKDTIREAMKVRLVDGKTAGGETALKNTVETGKDREAKKGRKALSGEGQEQDIDTFKATRKGQGLTAQDMRAAGEALRPIAEAARAILAGRQRNGEPLFETQAEFERALTEELFTPLMREGVLPENFIIDRFSEVQELLDATFAKYKERSAGDRDAAIATRARAQNKLHGSGTGGEQFGAIMQTLTSAPTALADKVGLNSDRRRKAGIVAAGGNALASMVRLGTTMQSWQVDGVSGKPKIETNFARQLQPDKKLFPQADPDAARSAMLQARRAQKIARLGFSEDEVRHVNGLLAIQENNDFASSRDGISGGADGVVTAITGVVLPALKVKALDDALASAHHEAASIDAALKAARAIDTLLVATLDKYIPGAGAALAGMYTDALDTDTVAEAASLTNPDTQAVIRAFALAFQEVLSDGIDPGLKPVGQAVARAFVGAAGGEALRNALKDNPGQAFDPMVAATRSVLDAQLRVVAGSGMRGTINRSLMKAVAITVADQIDEALVSAVGIATSRSAAEAFTGLYAAAVDVNGIAEAASADPVDGAAIVRMLSEAFAVAWKRAAPVSAPKPFTDVGKAMAAALRPGDHGAELALALAVNPGPAFAPVVQAATAAIGVGLSGASGLAEALASTDAQRDLASRAAFADGGDAAFAELDASEAELADYERQLVLIDEGGFSAAELHTIEGLIEKLERDRLIAQMILSVGGVLSGMGASAVTIVGQQAVAVTDTLVGEIVGPIKAAKLIIKFAVAMKQANDRRVLLGKFRKSLDFSKHAVSPMQSTVQGLFDNKVEQITFRTIEDAMTLLQVAAAVLGSVPEPITLAIGKTMGAAATAVDSASKLTEMIYNEAMLAKAWKITLAAIRNPRDRVTGLAALKLNPTLGMHALAWAGMERQPPEPIARALLADLGLNEQTLMASGSENKVRRYLETLLSEDRSLLNPALVTPEWTPRELRLSTASWAVTVQRAVELASPALRRTTEAEILACFKKVDRQALAALEPKARKGEIEAAEMDAALDDASRLTTLLLAYRPVASDGSDHDEMFNVAATFLKMAREHEKALNHVAVVNAGVQARDVRRIVEAATRTVVELDVLIGEDSEAGLLAGFRRACEQIRDIQFVDMQTDPGVKPVYEALLEKTATVGEVLQAKAGAPA